MSPRVNPRALMLPLAALAAVLVLLVVQLAFGGADYKPAAAANPCVEKPLPAGTQDLEQVTQTVVLTGLQSAACKLGVSRERLVLALPSEADRKALAEQAGVTDAQFAAALKGGMGHAVDRLNQAGQLPPASSLLDTYADRLDLPPLAQEAVRRLPASVIDSFLPTADVLQRAIEALDVNVLLGNLTNPDALQPALRQAIEDAAIAEAKERINQQLGSLSSFLNLG